MTVRQSGGGTATARGRSKPRVDRPLRRAQYIKVAADTFFELGLQSASMQDVADRAGVAKILIYREFPSKDALIAAIFEQVLEEIRGVFEGDWPGWGGGLVAVYRLACENRAAYLLLLRDSRSDPNTKVWREIYQQRQIAPFLTFLTPAPGAPAGAEERARIAARSLVGILTETLIDWIEERDGLTEDERREWFGHIVREWRRITRKVYRLDAPL